MNEVKKPVRQRPRTLPPPDFSERLLLRLAPRDVGIFRFLLESYDNLAFFTVLDRRQALLKIVFSPHQRSEARAALAAIGASVPLELHSWSRMEMDSICSR